MATTETQDPKAPKYGIRTYYQPKGLQKKMLNHVYRRYNLMKDSPDRAEAEKEWTRGRKQWEALRVDRGIDEWQSNHYVPMTTSVIESALSEMVDQSPRPMILARGSEDIPKSIVMSHIFDYTWDIADSDLELEDILHDALIEGTGIGQEYNFTDMRKIKTKRDGGSDQEPKWKEEDMLAFNGSYLEAVKNDDFFVDETGRGFRGPYAAKDCVRRYIMDIEVFKQFFKGNVWDPYGNAKFVQPGGDTSYWEWYKPPEGIDKSKQVEVLWYWSERPEDWLCIVANDVMVVMGPNPYRHKLLPFARAVDVRRTHKFYGKGEAALLESIQDELNTLRRMVIDRNHLDIDKMFIGSNRLNLSEEDLIARPHGFIPTDDINSVKAVEYADIPRSVELSMQHLEDDSTIVTGINPRSQALPTTGTATEAAILKESTLKRIRLKVRRFEREFLTRIARIRVSNIVQYYPQPKLEKIVGEVETNQYKQQVEELKAQGAYKEVDGVGYKQTYPKIRLENVDLAPSADGTFRENEIQGYSFFETKPEYFLPTNGGYDIKFAAGSTIPISKPLLQSKATEMFDRLLPLSLQVKGTYDPKKLGDMLIRVNDMNPADFSVQTQNLPADDASTRLEMAVELANTENSLMLRGKDVPPTPYAPQAHTLIHLRFTSSPTFQQLGKDDPRIEIFTKHIVGELAAQQERSQGTTSSPVPGQEGEVPPGASPMDQTQMGGNRTINDIMPDKIQGGGQVQSVL